MKKIHLLTLWGRRASLLFSLIIVASLLPVACGSSGTERVAASPMLGQGETWSYTFDEPGTYEIRCSPHSNMRLTVTVAETGQAGTIEARMQDSQFAPQELEVGVGGTVVWTNRDETRHDVVVNRVLGENQVR